MARPRADAHPWTLRLLEKIKDGEWYDYRDVLIEVSELVPPGMAWRKAEYYREYHYRSRGKEPSDRKYGDRNDTIKTGQRLIVGKSITDLRRRGRIEVEYDEASNSKRKTPKRIRRLV